MIAATNRTRHLVKAQPIAIPGATFSASQAGALGLSAQDGRIFVLDSVCEKIQKTSKSKFVHPHVILAVRVASSKASHVGAHRVVLTVRVASSKASYPVNWVQKGTMTLKEKDIKGVDDT